MEEQVSEVGSLVWARMKGFPAWPGMITQPILKEPSGGQKSLGERPGHSYVRFFGTHNFAWIHKNRITRYGSNSNETSIKVIKNKALALAVEEIEFAAADASRKLETSQDTKGSASNTNKNELKKKVEKVNEGFVVKKSDVETCDENLNRVKISAPKKRKKLPASEASPPLTTSSSKRPRRSGGRSLSERNPDFQVFSIPSSRKPVPPEDTEGNLPQTKGDAVDSVAGKTINLYKLQSEKGKSSTLKLVNENKEYNAEESNKKLQVSDKNAGRTDDSKNILEADIAGMKNTLDDMWSQLKCPVCLRLPRGPPIPMCPRGHYVCYSCKTPHCPSCGDSMGDFTSLLALPLIHIMEHQCRFPGCDTQLPLHSLAAHEEDCQQRLVACPGSGLHCQQSLSFSRLEHHVRECRDIITEELTSPEDGFTLSLSKKNNKTVVSGWPSQHFWFDDRQFFIVMGRRNCVMEVEVVGVGSKTEMLEYLVKIAVLNPVTKVGFQSKMSPKAINKERVRDCGRMSLTIPETVLTDILQQEVTEEGEVKYNMEVSVNMEKISLQ